MLSYFPVLLKTGVIVTAAITSEQTEKVFTIPSSLNWSFGRLLRLLWQVLAVDVFLESPDTIHYYMDASSRLHLGKRFSFGYHYIESYNLVFISLSLSSGGKRFRPCYRLEYMYGVPRRNNKVRYSQITRYIAVWYLRCNHLVRVLTLYSSVTQCIAYISKVFCYTTGWVDSFRQNNP